MNRLVGRLFIVALLIPHLLWGRQQQTLPSTLSDEIEQFVISEMKRQSVPGLSVAIAVDGKLAYSKGFGISDLEHSVAATADTVYRTASIAKPMTASAVMQLVESKKIDLDAPVQRYCPDFPEKQWPVTTRQVLGHLGGIRHYKAEDETVEKNHYFSLNQAVGIFKDDPLLHQPGTKYTYSTFGYNLLGCVVEGASGMRFEEYMKDKVFGPAGMVQTRSDDVYAIIPHRARGYMKVEEDDLAQLPAYFKTQVKAGDIVNTHLHDTSMKIPGGGLVSSAPDLVRFAMAVQQGRLVSKQTVELMWTRQKTSGGEKTSYGLGWGIGEMAGSRLISHSGSQAGVRTNLALLPEEGIAVAVMSNLENSSPQEMTRGLLEILARARVAAGQQ